MVSYNHNFTVSLKGILSFFDHRQNYLEIEGNLKILLHKDRKTPKTSINHKETRMVKDGED